MISRKRLPQYENAPPLANLRRAARQAVATLKEYDHAVDDGNWELAERIYQNNTDLFIQKEN